MEEYSKRVYEEELPHRQRYDSANRRYNRAKHPFRVTWQEAPYMRSLHMYERDVVTAHQNGISMLDDMMAGNTEYLAESQRHAQELRDKAAAEPDDVTRNKMLQMADHVETVAWKSIYERQAHTEDVIEARIELAEMRATKARYALANRIKEKNSVDGNRAMQMASERDLQDAYRAGLRKVARGNRRARALLKQADDAYANIERRLIENNITKDNADTVEAYNRNMDKAEEIRDAYRTSASMELWEAQGSADMRVSYAAAMHDAIHNPMVKPGLVGRILERLGLRKGERQAKNEEGETSPDDAKREDDPEWDRPEVDPVKPSDNFEDLYRSLMEHSQKDPKLGAIQNDVDWILSQIYRMEDILPAINYIAKQREYDPPSRRGKQTRKLRQELAEKLGMTEEQFISSPYGRTFSDFELEAIIELLDRAWHRSRASYDVYRRTGSGTALMQHQAELYRFLMLWERLRGAAAESGRSLRMFRDVKKRFGGAGEIMNGRTLDMVMNADLPTAGKMLHWLSEGSWLKMLMEYYINSLLSGPQTAVVNTLSGAMMVATEAILKPGIASVVGMTRYAFSAVIGRMFFKPMRAFYRALIRIFGGAEPNAWLDKKKAVEQDYADRIDPTDYIANRVRLGEVGARVRGLAEGLIPAAMSRTWLS